MDRNIEVIKNIQKNGTANTPGVATTKVANEPSVSVVDFTDFMNTWNDIETQYNNKYGVFATASPPDIDNHTVKNNVYCCSWCGEIHHDTVDRVCPECRKAWKILRDRLLNGEV